MSHVRTQLRENVAVLLNGINTGFPVTVLQNRAYTLDESVLPCINVQTGNETIETLTVDFPAHQVRTEQLILTIIVESVNAVDDLVDQICWAIELVLAGNVAMAKNFYLAGTSAIEPSAIGEKPIISVDMRYIAEIHTLENNPEAYL